MRWILLVVGALMLVTGLVWTLQGLNVLGGSAMTGNTVWAVIGPIVAVGGVVLVGLAVRRGRMPSR